MPLQGLCSSVMSYSACAVTSHTGFTQTRTQIHLLIPTWYTIFYINYIKFYVIYIKVVYQVGINKGIILRCTAYQISRRTRIFTCLYTNNTFDVQTSYRMEWWLSVTFCCRDVTSLVLVSFIALFLTSLLHRCQSMKKGRPLSPEVITFEGNSSSRVPCA